jgi:hypothetical protein
MKWSTHLENKVDSSGNLEKNLSLKLLQIVEWNLIAKLLAVIDVSKFKYLQI